MHRGAMLSPRVGEDFGLSRHAPSLFLLLPAETLLPLPVLLRSPLLSTPAGCPLLVAVSPGARYTVHGLIQLQVHGLIQAGGCRLAEASHTGSVSLEQEALAGRAAGSQAQMPFFVRLLQGSAVSRHLDRGGGREGAPPQQSHSCSILAFDAQCLREKGDQGNCRGKLLRGDQWRGDQGILD